MNYLSYQTQIARSQVSFGFLMVTWLFTAAANATSAVLTVLAAACAPSNHVSLDIRWSLVLVVIATGWTAFMWLLERRLSRTVMALVVSAVLLAGIVLVFDRFNVLVEYDTWVQRGMPERWAMQGG
jgi:hypothetical protein